MREYTHSPLLTDLYQLTMLQAYFQQGMDAPASFEFFVRRLPAQRNFLMAAGLEQLVAYLTSLRFDSDDIAALRDTGLFDAAFLASLEDFRFTGDVDAMPEGSIFFADEPVLRVTAPLREAQFIESRLLNLLHYPTMIASKAARCVLAAGGKRLVDFGMRRAHGAEAALLSARASYIAGFEATATVVAGALYGIPVSGTMAHSYIQTHERESDAFAAFVRSFPDNTTLLIDTYDTEAAAAEVVRLAQALRKAGGGRIRSVRIDSGELGSVAERVRAILDAGGCQDIAIFATGNLDEAGLQALEARQVPIDGYGVGTRMNTSADIPYLDAVYKLVEYAGRPRRKRSTGKATWPGCKQVFRRYDGQGAMCGDVLAGHREALAGEPLLKPVLRGGVPAGPPASLAQVRAHAKAQLDRLPPWLRALDSADAYPVEIADSLRELARQADQQQRTGG